MVLETYKTREVLLDVDTVMANFEKWIFLKCLHDEILRNEFNTVIFDEHDIPVRGQLIRAVGKI